MKPLLTLLLLGFVSAHATAITYKCKGVDRADDNKKVEISFKVTVEDMEFTDEEGNVRSIARRLRRNERALKYASYRDDTIDGYGGFIQVSIPKEVLKGTMTEPFFAYYSQHIYSEMGHVGTVDVRAKCGEK
ncbi:MAG: hypothetical protein HY537_16345 [Deltaproteobacteria bacterium]|nr:hypothetical protein [Deltaproteobacteria bacterium]